MGQNSTFFRGTLEKMLSEGLQTAQGPEARGQHLFQSPEEKGRVLTLYHGFVGFPLQMHFEIK